MAKISKEEYMWMAQDDARILSHYQEILNDSDRLKRAQKEAKKQADNLIKQANNMKKISNMKGEKNGKTKNKRTK